MKIKLERFLKVFTAKGIHFEPLNENMAEAPEYAEVIDITEVEGYGVFVGDTWRVLPTLEQAERMLA